jgi:choline dehydrogenase
MEGSVLDAYDYIIVGAGSAGCVIAGNLAAAGNSKILVLEAGPRDRSPWIHLPIGYGKTYYNPAVNWMYETEPQSGLAGRKIYQPRGKVVGGSSSINAMVYSRGQAADYDGWAVLGNRGWAWPDVLRLYRRMEDHDLGASAWHGAGGPLHITDTSKAVHPLTDLFIKAGLEAGLPFNPDLNGETTEGVGTYQITTRGGLRESAARAYLKPALKTGRVRLETEALVTRVLFDGRRAIGVECRQHGQLKTFHAGAEIILCGGAINSPQILQLSGIGPGSLLAEHAIEVVADRSAVGRHFQDHLCYDHVYISKLPSLNDDLLPLSDKIRVALAYLFGRRGPLSLSVNQGGGFYRSRAGLDRPDIQLYFSPLSYEKAQPRVRALMKPDPFSGFSTSVSPCRPLSRGYVAIRTPDPAAAPKIEPNYLSAPEDVETLLTGARFLCGLAETPTFKTLVDRELKPGGDRHSDAALIDDIRQRAYSVFHPSGTCRMGLDPADCVVDPALRVHGVAGLRVADASIFPTVPSGNTGAPAMMVGEKASELILGR